MHRRESVDRTDIEQLSWMYFATIRRMNRSLDLHSHELEKQFGLTVPQLNVLWLVGRTDKAPIGQIAEQASLSSATLTSIVDRLEKHGLVARERSEDDKRQVLIAVTETGRQLLDRRPQPFHESFTCRLEELEHWQGTELLASLQRVASMMEQ